MRPTQRTTVWLQALTFTHIPSPGIWCTQQQDACRPVFWNASASSMCARARSPAHERERARVHQRGHAYTSDAKPTCRAYSTAECVCVCVCVSVPLDVRFGITLHPDRKAAAADATAVSLSASLLAARQSSGQPGSLAGSLAVWQAARQTQGSKPPCRQTAKAAMLAVPCSTRQQPQQSGSRAARYPGRQSGKQAASKQQSKRADYPD